MKELNSLIMEGTLTHINGTWGIIRCNGEDIRTNFWGTALPTPGSKVRIVGSIKMDGYVRAEHVEIKTVGSNIMITE